MTLLLCLSKSLMSVIYLVQKLHLKSSFHVVYTEQKVTQEKEKKKDRCMLSMRLQGGSAVYQANKLKDCLRDSNPLCSTVH